MTGKQKSRAPWKRATFRTTYLHTENSIGVKVSPIERIFAALSNRRYSRQTTGCSWVTRNEISFSLATKFFPGNGLLVDHLVRRMCLTSKSSCDVVAQRRHFCKRSLRMRPDVPVHICMHQKS